MNVAVIGGGVIGLLCAFELRRRGADVVVVDAGPMGGGCSTGNGGWVCPSIATPLPGPGTTTASLRWLLRADSPLYIRPAAIPGLAGWLWAFRGHCNRASYDAGVAALAALSERAADRYENLVDADIDCELERRGTLLATADPAELEREAEVLRALEPYGVGPVEVWDRGALLADQPSLAPELAGALLVRSDAHVRPESLCGGLVAWLEENGARLWADMRVTGFRVDGRVVRAAATSAETIEADAFVLATGAEIGGLARTLGLELPVTAGKGYSITIDGAGGALTRPVHIGDAKMGFTPFEGALRVLGTMELSGINARLDPRRVAALERAAIRYIPDLSLEQRRVDWVGMRPVTPDGLPVIGPAPGVSNAFVATGHQMLGVTLAPATGVAIAELVLEGRSSVELTRFGAGRFRRA
ncbi:MAG: FAD-dependent oxidoreductase [Gemmatimonadetes bacterium]|nr:FAD-dependent oxidoreductase [Gemmatimonadota bacterium]